MMRNIRAKDTKPEMIIRKGLHRRGFRYVLHDKRLPGKPDMVFPKYRAVIFVHGCFWHGHDCHLFKWPKTRTEFWKSKIIGNKSRDYEIENELLIQHWRICKIWECSLKGKKRLSLESCMRSIADWLRSDAHRFTMTSEL
ncbi:very short patch repair endonuclease [Sphingorhabdus sp. Alg239-R122]|uniref:very short patch repair endonuclease n=1 Tax=Sphingorhabdus sp. Alg239-R122 TaxID=2305989 RepID=UPI0031F680A6